MPVKKKSTSSLKDLQKEGAALKERGQWEAASNKFSKLIKGAREKKDVALFLDAAIGYGDCETRRGNFRVAVETFLEALKAAETFGDSLKKAAVLRGLGYVHWRKGDMSMAIEYYNMALEILASNKDQALLGKIHIDIGNIYTAVLDARNAEAQYNRGIDILRELDGDGAKFDMGRAYNNLCSLNMDLGHFARAIEFAEKGIGISKEINDANSLMWPLLNIAESYTHLNENEKAKGYLDECMGLIKLTDDKVALTAVLRVYAVIHFKDGRKDKAKEYFMKSLDIGRDLEIPEVLAYTLKEYGIFLCETGKTDEGVKMLKELVGIYTDFKSAHLEEAKKLYDKYSG